MPITFAMQDDIGVFTTIGDVDFQQGVDVFKHGMSQLQAMPVPQLMLFDIRQSTEQRNSDEMRELVRVVEQYLPKARMALLAESGYLYGMSRMFSQLASVNALEARAFESLDAALLWLQL